MIRLRSSPLSESLRERRLQTGPTLHVATLSLPDKGVRSMPRGRLAPSLRVIERLPRARSFVEHSASRSRRAGGVGWC